MGAVGINSWKFERCGPFELCDLHEGNDGKIREGVGPSHVAGGG